MVANFEGAVNATTLTCNVINEGNQIGTIWSVSNFGGVPSRRNVGTADPDRDFFLISGTLRPNSTLTFGNRITILNWTSAVDTATLFCGTGREPEQASVVLRIYSKLCVS